LLSDKEPQIGWGPAGDAGAASLSAVELRERRRHCVAIVRQLLENMEAPNLVLLQALVCVLWHIARASDTNKMSPKNLGVCIGQSLLHSGPSSAHRTPNANQQPEGNLSSSPSATSGELRRQQQTPASGKLRLLSLSLSSSSSNLSGPETVARLAGPASELRPAGSEPSPKGAKRHRRAKSQSLFASSLSLSSLAGQPNGKWPAGAQPLPAAPQRRQEAPGGSVQVGGPQMMMGRSVSSGVLSQPQTMLQETAKYVPILFAFLIDEARQLFGPEVVELFADRPQTLAQVEAHCQPTTRAATPTRDEELATDRLGGPGGVSAPPEVEGHPQRQTGLKQHLQADGNAAARQPASVLVHVGAAAEMEKGSHAHPLLEGACLRDAHEQRAQQCAGLQRRLQPDGTTSIVIEQPPRENAPLRRVGRSPELADRLSELANDHQQAEPSAHDQPQLQTRGHAHELEHTRGHAHREHSLQQRASSSLGQEAHAAARQRPLSVTGSTVSSSSTSGVHSESPVFSSSASAASSSSGASRHLAEVRGGRMRERRGSCASSSSSSGSSGSSSRSPSSSSSSSSSGCPSPECSSSSAGSAAVSPAASQPPADRLQARPDQLIEVTLDQLASRADARWPLGLRVKEAAHEQQAARDQVDAGCVWSACSGAPEVGPQPAERALLGARNSHSLARHTSLGALASRTPKIPFEYTTSSYGGQAVLYCPVRVQQQQQRQHFGRPASPQHAANAADSLPAGLKQQQQQPSRSHVLMLRDYYLSLQRQAHEHKRAHQLEQRHLLAANRTEAQNLHPRTHQERLLPQHNHHNSHNHNNLHQQSLSLADLSGRGGAPHAAGPQLVHSAVQPAATARPRLARIRPNQFGGLYVRGVAAGAQPAHLSHAANAGAGPPLPQGPAADPKRLPRAASSSHLGSLARSSAGSSGHNSAGSSVSSADESDEWTESTMV